MRSTTVIWTALPAGKGEHGFRLSVVASLQLTTPAPERRHAVLSDYPAMVDWPAVLSGVQFCVLSDGGTFLPTEQVRPDPETAAGADGGAWRALFPADSPVLPFTHTDVLGRGLRTAPVRETVAYAQQLYTNVTRTSGSGLPSLASGPLGALVTDLGPVRTRLDRHEATPLPEAAPDRARVADLTHRETPTEAFVQAARFFDRVESRPQPGPHGIPHVDDVTPPTLPEFDIHHALAALGDSPTLLRRFGLVVDLLLDELPDGRALRVIPRWSAARPDDLVESTPWTAFQPDPFLPRPKEGSDLENGWLRLRGVDDNLIGNGAADRSFDLVQIDPDGTALKLVDLADSGRRLLGSTSGSGGKAVSYDTPTDAGLPALQSGGLALARHRRDERVGLQLASDAMRSGAAAKDPEAMGDRPASDEILLYADDLVRGYRPDIQDATDGAWRSLCHRTARRTVRRGDQPFDLDGAGIVEEGYVREAPVSSADTKDSDLYLGETVVRWSGWSLVAPRPGRTVIAQAGAAARDAEEVALGTATLPIQAEHIGTPAVELDPSFPLQTDTAPVPGSLPALRYGHDYRLRVRVVDLAGNSIDPLDRDDRYATEPVTYRRFEPVPAPTLVPRAPFREGASVERMVIRSDRDLSTTQYAVAHPWAGSAIPGQEAADERHVVPPMAAELTVETSGLLDDALRPGGDPATAYLLAAREANTLRDQVGVDPADLDTLVRTAHPGVVMVDGHDPLGQGPDGRPAVPGAYLTITTEQPIIDYLPDPASEGAVLTVVDPEAHQLDRITLGWRQHPGQPWHAPRPFRLRIIEAAPGVTPVVDPDAGLVVLPLGKADLLTIRYCSQPDMERILRENGIWDWATRDASWGGADRLYDELKRGRLWPVTPFRTLTLVHATQHPLATPALGDIDPIRQPGDTFAELAMWVETDPKSTGTLDVDAQWTDWFPDATTGTVSPDGRAHIAQLPVDRALAFPGRAPHPERFVLTARGPVRGSGSHTKRVTQEFGDTRHRVVTYRVRGTTPFREYFPPSISEDVSQLSTAWASHTPVHIRSSARPDAPTPRYAVPTWRWEPEQPPSTGWTTMSRVRRGGGVRVWLDNPWWSSGEGEMLGVVMREGPAEDVDDRLVPFVTRLGRDPMWDVPAPPTGLAPKDVAGATRPGKTTGLRLAEIDDPDPRLTVSVAALAPEFDLERRLWYADLELPEKANRSYTPFVRLALARFQPWSLDGVELSRVVVVDPIQLLPDRHLRLDRRPGGVDVSVSGPAPATPYANAVSVTVEMHDGSTPGELGWHSLDTLPGRPNPVWLSDLPPVLTTKAPRSVRIPASSALRWPERDLDPSLDIDVDALRAARIPLRAARVAVDRPAGSPPAIGRFLTDDQRERLTAATGVTLDRLQSQLAPVIASPIAASHSPALGVADLARYGIDRHDMQLPLPAYLLQPWKTWQGLVPVPQDPSGPCRLVVREHEYAPTDRRVLLPGGWHHVHGSRVVYADTVRL